MNRPRAFFPSLSSLLVVAALAAACKDPDASDPLAQDADALAKGAAIYVESCSVCHGSTGQGGTAPALAATTRSDDELRSIIAERMPPGSPGRCQGRCAEYVTRYLRAGLTAGPPSCTGRSLGVRRLRLLTRREYQNTLADLLPKAATCQPPLFSYDAGARMPKTVHVAGSFNGWPGTVQAGGWAMSYSAADRRWQLSRALDPGTYSYKFVIDEKDWVTDPGNPRTMPDGFGGQNSVLTVTCKPGDSGERSKFLASLIAELPEDSRPEGYGFDNAADARLISSLHLDGYRKGAGIAAKQVVDNLPAVLACDPTGGRAATCADEFLRGFGMRAFRRPLRDSERARYQALILKQKSFAEGISAAVQALLISPHFLYRSELGERQADGSYRLSSYEVASALSYLFWASLPDAALFDAAARGELSTRSELRAQAQRLLADPRAREVLGGFGLAYLGAEDILTKDKSAVLYPDFGSSARLAMADETRRLFAHVIFDGSGRFSELFTADYSFLNAELARRYGVALVTGDALRKVSYGSAPRAGVLGHGSVLGSFAHSDQSSPIRRGLFVRQKLLCQELPPPPPNAGRLPAVDPNATTRERFRQHSSTPFCKGCHQYIDEVGFGFERYDAVGGYRESENGKAIDSAGDLNDLEVLGSATHAPYASLKELGGLLADSPRARRCFVRKATRYVRGAQEDVAEDLCTLWRLESRFADSGHDIKELFLAIAESDELLYRADPSGAAQGGGGRP